MSRYTECYLDLVELEIAGLIQSVIRDDGQTGYILTPLGNHIADLLESGEMELTEDEDDETDDL